MGTDERVSWRAAERFRTASTVKMLVHAAVLAAAGTGDLSLDARVVLSERDLTGGSGVLNVLRPGLSLTVADLCTLMIVVSDNTATNMLLDLLGGTEKVNAAIARLGYEDVALHRRLEYAPPPLVAGPRPALAPPTVPFGTATPAALCRFVASVHAGQVVSAAASRALFDTLRHQQLQSGVPRAFLALGEPGGPTDEIPTVANKTGSVPGCRAEAGLLGLPGGRWVAYAVMADDLADHTMTCLAEGDELLGRVGSALLEHWWGGPGPAPLRPGWRGEEFRGNSSPSQARA